VSEEEAYKIFSKMTPDVLDYVFCLAKAYTEKDKEIERLKKETLSHHTKLIIAKGKQIVLQERIDKAIKCINDYAIEDEDYSKIYNQEERELLSILDKVEKENDIEFDVLKALNTDLDDDIEMG